MLGDDDSETTAWLMVIMICTLTIAAFFAVALLVASL